MRIAFLVDPLTLRSRGGGHAPALAQELLNRGHVLRAFGALPGRIPASKEAFSGPVEYVESRGLLGFRPDAVLAYDALSPSAWLGARAMRRLRGALVLVETGQVAGDQRLHQRLLMRLGESLWGGYVRATARAVVALDAAARAQVLEQGFRSDMVDVLLEGVDLQQYRPGLTSQLIARHRIRGRILLYAGPLEAGRDLELLVAAFAATVGQRPDWSLVLAGEGSAKARLRAQCERLGVAERVHWLGRARAEELAGLISSSTLYAAPDHAGEARGRQVARALACGVPVLCTDLPRLAGLVTNGERGLLLAPGRLDAWIEGLTRASSSPVSRTRWGVNARAFAEVELAWPALAQRFEATLERARSRVAA